jgi:hypothetical protein
LGVVQELYPNNLHKDKEAKDWVGFLKAMSSSRTDRRIRLVVVAGHLVGFLPVLFLQVERCADREIRLRGPDGGIAGRQANGAGFHPDERMLMLASQAAPKRCSDAWAKECAKEDV